MVFYGRPKSTERNDITLNPFHIVVLQSDAAVREHLHALLAQAGMEVQSFPSPLAFLEVIDNGHIPDLLLADLCLNDLDGWRLCRLLRAPGFAHTHALPLLLTSSTFLTADLAHIAQNLGANGYLSLPAKPEAALAAVRATLDRSHRQRPVALAVTSDDTTQRLIARTLESAGYNVIPAVNQAEARRLFAERLPTVVVLDDFLSDGRAQEVLAEWYGQGNARPAVCLVATDTSDRTAAIEFARCGVDACLHKPFTSQVLERALADALLARTLRNMEAQLQQKTLRLHESERSFRELYDKAPLGYHTIGPDGTILSMNATELQWLGYTREELVGCKTIFDLQTPESAERGRRVFKELKHVGSLHDVDLVLLRKNGTPLPVSIVASVARIESDDFVLSRTIVRDMTDRQEEEMQSRQAQRVESMATLVEGIAHNFNNLLTPVLINASELLDSFPLGSEERVIVEEIADTSKKAAKMIRQLALLGRSSRPPRHPVNLQLMIAEVVAELREKFDPTTVIETDIASEPAVVTGHTAELKRALMELCFNAHEALPSGGILTISLSRAPGPASGLSRPASPPVANGWAIAVSDTGLGVPPEIREQVFEPFFTTKPMSVHAGLGLSTAYATMRNHGGRAELDLRERGRTRFVLRFPVPLAHVTNASDAPLFPEKPA